MIDGIVSSVLLTPRNVRAWHWNKMQELKPGYRVVVPLGIAQTIGWGSSYYSPAILAEPISRDIAISPVYVFGLLTAALIVAGIIGPRVGALIDRLGGRGILLISNGLFAAGLTLTGLAQNVGMLVIAWLIIGIGMGTGLYEAAFASLTRLYGVNARRSISGITLIAGFASTVGWPLTAYIEARYGWRTACFMWAALHLVLALPLNLLVPAIRQSPAKTENETPVSPPVDDKGRRRVIVSLAAIFTAAGFVASGVAAIMPSLLVSFGATPTAAIAASTLIGPVQVVARLLEAGFLSRFHPLYSARLSCIMHPVGAFLMVLLGPMAAPLFVMFYAAGNGILTISRGTLPLALFGSKGYGRLTGIISAPARITGALAPLVIGLLVERGGMHVLWLTCGLSLAAFGLLLSLSAKATISQQ